MGGGHVKMKTGEGMFSKQTLPSVEARVIAAGSGMKNAHDANMKEIAEFLQSCPKKPKWITYWYEESK